MANIDYRGALEPVFHRLHRMGFSEIKEKGGTLCLVGGMVRDAVLGVESNDIDVLVTGMSMGEIIKTLSAHGMVKLAGKSYAVIKYTYNGETIDVAVPRSDAHVDGGGHKDVIVTTDGVGLVEDLARRDFTINAMAVTDGFVLVDPFGGLEDARRGLIRCVDESVFAMDPLRMLRAAVFAARFNFNIEAGTAALINKHCEWIRRVPGERYEKEIAKAHSARASVKNLMFWMQTTGLYDAMFETQEKHVDVIKTTSQLTYSDFFYLVLSNTRSPEKEYKWTMKGASNVFEEISAISRVVEVSPGMDKVELRKTIQAALERAPSVISSGVLWSICRDAMAGFAGRAYPKSRLDLAIGGGALLDIGVSNKDIGRVQCELMSMVLSDTIKNDRRSLLLAASVINEEILNDK